MQPKFLLLMPSYNQSSYIADAVRSVLAQDDPDWELWIVDNSTDATPEVMRAFTDPRIRFFHIAERMDPGSCLNWMLARAEGPCFSYLHTDNNLLPSYVRRMREALQGRPLGLAYCDMYTMDAEGRRLYVFRRGEFDLARLLSLDTLGVPFAATTELARQLGGFGSKDYADDVRFCISAYGLAQYVYVRAPLVDYRAHAGSRTEAAGGRAGMVGVFLRTIPAVGQLLEKRGVPVRQVMSTAVEHAMEDMQWSIENRWYRTLHKLRLSHLDGGPELLFNHYLLRKMGIGRDSIRKSGVLDANDASSGAHNIWSRRLPRIVLPLDGRLRRALRDLIQQPLSSVLPWACFCAGAQPEMEQTLRARSADFRTLWVACQLHAQLGWTPLWDSAERPRPSWLNWSAANGTEPLLDCNGKIALG